MTNYLIPAAAAALIALSGGAQAITFTETTDLPRPFDADPDDTIALDVGSNTLSGTLTLTDCTGDENLGAITCGGRGGGTMTGDLADSLFLALEAGEAITAASLTFGAPSPGLLGATFGYASFTPFGFGFELSPGTYTLVGGGGGGLGGGGLIFSANISDGPTSSAASVADLVIDWESATVVAGENDLPSTVSWTLSVDVSGPTPIPVPAGLPLLLGGLALAGYATRRKRG